MIAVECPQCGAATPAFPLTPDRVACRACKYDGPPRPEVVAQLRAAAAQLGDSNAHHARAIGAVQAAAHGLLLRRRATLHRMLVILILPFGSCGACTVFASLVDDPNYTVALLCGIPLLTFGLAMLLGSRYLDAQARKLAEAFGAVPPATPGAPARCHLCGAPLPPATNESPIARCRHCGADNIASPEVLGDIVKKRQIVIGKFAEGLAARAGAMAMNSASAVTLVIILGCASPFIGCVGAFGLETALDYVELDPLPSEYVLTSVKGQVCASLVKRKHADGRFELVQPHAETMVATVSGGARYTRVPAKWFLHKRVASGSAGQSKGVVTSVFVNVLRPERNQAWIRAEGENAIDFARTIEGMCLVEPPPGLALLDWPSEPPLMPSASATGTGAPPPPDAPPPPFATGPSGPKGRAR